MKRKINASQKGFLTAIIMIGVSLILFSKNQGSDTPLQYLIYFFYVLGIVWTLIAYSRSVNGADTFGKMFLEGFKCFIVVTLLMVVFTFIFNKIHPEFKEQIASGYKDEVIKQGNSTPNEVEDKVAKIKDQYLTILVSRTIFAYLFLGAVITAITSLVIKRTK